MYTISDLNKDRKHMTREERIAALKEELACLRTELRIKYKSYQRQFLFREPPAEGMIQDSAYLIRRGTDDPVQVFLFPLPAELPHPGGCPCQKICFAVRQDTVKIK